jgi:prolyl-tRNA synthetase
VYTPGKAAIADVAEFFQISPAQDIKTVAYMGQRLRIGTGKIEEKPIVVFLRGDHQVNETKLAAVATADTFRPMRPEELDLYFKGPGGFLGPIGLTVLPAESLKISGGYYDQTGLQEAKKKYQQYASVPDDPSAVTVILDKALEGRENMVAGANKLDYHFRNVTPGRDFGCTVAADIRNAEEGEGCPVCGAPLKIGKAVEVGHIFKLGRRYTEGMGSRVLDPNGKEVIPIMGCYGIGVERILTASIEQNNDANGFWLPPAIAPFDVVVTITNVSDQNLLSAGTGVAEALESAGFEVLLDDRDERAGVKFKDADLVGIPYRINVGKKAAEGKVELVTRGTASSEDVAIAEVADVLRGKTGRA